LSQESRRYHGYALLGPLLVTALLWLDTAGAYAMHSPRAVVPAPRQRTAAPATPSPLTGGWKRLTTTAPQPVAGAALAWDGADRVMFLFGGAVAGASSDAFWAYRPAANKAGAAGWTRPAASGDSPGARDGAGAVWDDHDGVLLVLDGAEKGRETDGLYAYKPGRGIVSGRGASSGRWTNVTTGGGPLRRAYHSAVWDSADGVMILFGGETNGVPLGDTWLYKPGKGGLTPGSWTRVVANGPSARQHAMAAWDGADGALLLAGGTGYTGLLSDLWSFHPARGRARASWTRLSASTPLGPRAGGAAAWDSAGKRLLVFGGQVAAPTPTAAPAPPRLVIRATPVSTDTASPTISATPSATAIPPTATPSATTIPSATPSATAIPTATPSATSTTAPTGTPTQPPPSSTATAVPSNTASPTATAVATGAAAASGPAMTITLGLAHAARGHTVPALAGAEGLSGARSAYVTARDQTYSDDLWAYTSPHRGTGAGSWRLLRQGGGLLARASGAVYDDKDRTLLLYGGQSISTLGDLWSYPSTGRAAGRWALLNGGQPQARAGQSGAWDARDSVLFVFGGYSATRLNDLWAYQPAHGATGRWTPIPVVGPAPRTESTLIWDSADNVLLLFGGAAAGGSLNDVWAYRPAGDGTAPGRWISLSVAGALPAARHLHTAVWDSAHRQMLVLAGEAGTAVPRDLWAFRLDSLAGARGHWRLIADQAAPPARFAQAAVWDPSASRMLVFGGVNGAGAFIGDLWSYRPAGGNGAGSWTALGAPGLPNARASTAAAWDGADNLLLIFGGTDGDHRIRDDTYAYRAASGWSLLARAHGPSNRNGATGVYDTVNNALLLFGGADATGAMNDLWQLGGYQPAARSANGGKSKGGKPGHR